MLPSEQRLDSNLPSAGCALAKDHWQHQLLEKMGSDTRVQQSPDGMEQGSATWRPEETETVPLRMASQRTHLADREQLSWTRGAVGALSGLLESLSLHLPHMLSVNCLQLG